MCRRTPRWPLPISYIVLSRSTQGRHQLRVRQHGSLGSHKQETQDPLKLCKFQFPIQLREGSVYKLKSLSGQDSILECALWQPALMSYHRIHVFFLTAQYFFLFLIVLAVNLPLTFPSRRPLGHILQVSLLWSLLQAEELTSRKSHVIPYTLTKIKVKLSSSIESFCLKNLISSHDKTERTRVLEFRKTKMKMQYL